MRRFGWIVLACLSMMISAAHAAAATYDWEVVRGGAVIGRKGPATGFPSVIRIPDWIEPERRAHPDAKYYLYFCSDGRECLYMKWAKSPAGPWREFNLGGVFNGHARRGVFDLVTDPVREMSVRVDSADVHVDHEARQVVLLFQGDKRIEESGPNAGRCIRLGLVATSEDGLNFNDPATSGGQAGHGPRTVTVGETAHDIAIAPGYQRAFRHRGDWHSLSRRGVIAKAPPCRGPWAADPKHPTEIAWKVEETPGRLWREDASDIQERYISPAATFLASSEFASHPNNPHPGVRFDSSEARIDDLGVCALPDDQLEVFFCIREDAHDKFDGIYRLVYDISAPEFQHWTLKRDDAGEVMFEVVLTPEDITMAVRAVRPDADPIYYADPVSLGDPYIFIDDDSEKYLYFSYGSERFGGYEGAGQISAVRIKSAR